MSTEVKVFDELQWLSKRWSSLEIFSLIESSFDVLSLLFKTKFQVQLSKMAAMMPKKMRIAMYIGFQILTASRILIPFKMLMILNMSTLYPMQW
ncbi:hypothetical protein LWI28_008299 [Acer negundo]|uniref:Uncharacterized protein n=1 Tax=Acer negundo TaxID=4023 RepID=A0AAD5NG56_ACENE|nr:hypothetical protein LWI28_008299 [Acer negundo]KAK4835233.1 hypothetical protein QYF36_007151 [Acer negundo]